MKMLSEYDPYLFVMCGKYCVESRYGLHPEKVTDGYDPPNQTAEIVSGFSGFFLFS